MEHFALSRGRPGLVIRFTVLRTSGRSVGRSDDRKLSGAGHSGGEAMPPTTDSVARHALHHARVRMAARRSTPSHGHADAFTHAFRLLKKECTKNKPAAAVTCPYIVKRWLQPRRPEPHLR